MSVPVPIAIPTSAWASAGASLMPSPTIATTFPSAWSALTSSALRSGSTPATTRSIPASLATLSAVRGSSPVSITTSSPIPRRRRTASTRAVLDRVGHRDHPRRAAVHRHADGRAAGARDLPATDARSGPVETPASSSQDAFPARTARPPTVARIPFPGTEWKSSGGTTSIPASLAPRTTASASGCAEPLSAQAASRSSSRSPASPAKPPSAAGRTGPAPACPASRCRSCRGRPCQPSAPSPARRRPGPGSPAPPPSPWRP